MNYCNFCIKILTHTQSCFQTWNSSITEKNIPLEKYTFSTSRLTEANTTIFPTIGTTQPTEKCVKAAIEQFPRSIIGPTARKYGAIIIHILICVYSFFGLAITCDNYFVTSLDRICEGKIQFFFTSLIFMMIYTHTFVCSQN